MSKTNLRQFFPIFQDQAFSSSVYFDSAATSLKHTAVIEASKQYYQQNTANVHRSSYAAALQVTQQFEQARRTVQKLIGAHSFKEIIWTKGATDSLNLVASCLARSTLLHNAGNEILITASEHHSNIVPWQVLAKQLGLSIKVMPVDKNGVLDLDQSLALISPRTALVAIGQVSNALGNINPIQQIIQQAKLCQALTVIDGTQAVAHMQVNVVELKCDFYAFSGHKMFGPTGIGVLYGKIDLLEQLPPYQTGGEMVQTVSFYQDTTYQPSPLKFEAGTPNIAGVLGIAAASTFVKSNMQSILATEQHLYKTLLAILKSIPEVRLWGDSRNSISLQAFTVEGVDVFDLALLLDQNNIAVRVGHHCAMPLVEELGLPGLLRVSLACYNTEQELRQFEIALKHSISILLKQDMAIAKNTVRVPAVPAHEPISTSQLGPIAKSIKIAKGWDNTYRQLMLAGKNLHRLADTDKTPSTEVLGCESQVWVKCELINDKVALSGDSASKIVRGLLAVIFEVLGDASIQHILSFDLAQYLSNLGLSRHLSESRGNGLAEVVKKIVAFCELNNTR